MASLYSAYAMKSSDAVHLVNVLAPVMPSIASLVAAVVSVLVPLLHFVFEFLV